MKRYKAYKVNDELIVVAETIRDAELTYRTSRDFDDENAVKKIEQMFWPVLISPDIDPNAE